MSSWMKSSFYFDDRMACFTLSRRFAYQNKRVFEAIHECNNDPDALEKAILGIIERCRPDLKGAMLHAMSYSHQLVAWEISVSHPSLPKLQPGCLLPRIPLVKEIEDTTLQDYMKANNQSWFAELTPVADVPLTVK